MVQKLSGFYIGFLTGAFLFSFQNNSDQLFISFTLNVCITLFVCITQNVCMLAYFFYDLWQKLIKLKFKIEIDRRLN